MILLLDLRVSICVLLIMILSSRIHNCLYKSHNAIIHKLQNIVVTKHSLCNRPFINESYDKTAVVEKAKLLTTGCSQDAATSERTSHPP